MNVAGLISMAILDRDGSKGREAGYQHLFTEGDLMQMAEIGRVLRDNGFDVGFCNVYPAVKTEEEYLRALKLIWERKVTGWWNYGHKFVKHKICTQDQFNEALRK